MLYRMFTLDRIAGMLLVILLVLTGLTPALPLQAAALQEPAVTTVELTAIDDAGATQRGDPNTPHGAAYLVLSKDGPGNYDNNFVQFDLSVLPANLIIDAAEIRLHIFAFGGPALDVDVSRVDAAWDESTLTWNSQPAVTGGGPVRSIAAIGDVSWPVTPLAQAWQDGSQPNHGVMLRGLNSNGAFVGADSKETNPAHAPTLVITYREPADGTPRPDLGDAPDSSNHHGINNTAYVGVNGNFPTVWDGTAVGQPAGPRHLNGSGEGWLGNFLSRELEADTGPDQDAPNNILRNAAGVIGDVADHDRGDDGWRNRNIRFFDCRRQTLEIRISKAAAATRNMMYLNVWFDGNRDGDWSDLGQCQAAETEPAQAGYEWIVQNYIIDMTAIAAGGSRDFSINTEKVLNATEGQRHWMRFTLSEVPATQPGADLADGRGPHPSSPLGSYQFGETEDVLQRPPLPGEDGVLEIQKRVIPDSEPVEWLDLVTYQILLRHNGGSQPIQAQIRDILPYPLAVYPTIDAGGIQQIVVESATGGAAPLQATLDFAPPSAGNPAHQIVKWQGVLAPNAEVKLTFKVRVFNICEPNQQTRTIRNVAEARPHNGAVINAEASFVAQCLGYDENSIQIDPNPIEYPIENQDWTHFPWQGTVWNKHPYSVTLGFFQQPAPNGVAASAAVQPRFLDRVTLAPDEKQLVDLDLRMESEFTDELMLADDYSPIGNLIFCIMPDPDSEDNSCADAAQYPQLMGEVPLPPFQPQPNDLGDAPDSSNHAGVAMAAYPGVQALFPTVFDPATGLPEGPRHGRPRPFHLGQRVSLEAEADMGPDQDPLNNIEPAANDPDNDRRDDGTNLALWNLNHCQTTTLPVQVTITPQAVNYFQQLGTTGYLNIWIDSSRNGEWQEVAQCGQQPAPEHIVIDFPVNVVGLGAGLHLLNVPTGLVPWQITDKPAWVRMTLSELPANKTLTAAGLHYGDGRGYANPFKTGETEDTLYRPVGADGAGPDIEVYLSGSSRQVTSQTIGVQAATDKLGNFEIQDFKIDYANRGSQTATGAVLTFTKPPQLRDLEILLLHAPGIPSQNIAQSLEEISFTLPELQPGATGSILLSWRGEPHTEYTASVRALLASDVDGSNNQSSTTLRGLLSSPLIGAFMDYTDDSCMDHIVTGRAVTNRTSLQLRGQAAPNQIIAILIGLVQVATVNSDANGNFVYTAQLDPGRHRITARYATSEAAALTITSPRDAASGLVVAVKPMLPYDPMSLCFTDSQGRAFFLPTLGYSFGATQTGSFLRSGETYTVSVNTSGGDPNQYVQVTFGGTLLASLTDTDGDGVYQGLVIMPDPGVVQSARGAAATELALIVGRGTTASRFSTSVTSALDGLITDRATGQPLADASVALLTANHAGTRIFFSGWPTQYTGQPNPQVTGADGKYSYYVAEGSYRIDVVRNGYQSYRSGDLAASAEELAKPIALTPAIAAAATQTIYVNETGFSPAVVTVPPGAVIEWINVGLEEHSITSSAVDSGLLAPGASYKVQLTTAGTLNYADSQDSRTRGTLMVGTSQPTVMSNTLFLPIVTR